jgi:hypothetical protein
MIVFAGEQRLGLELRDIVLRAGELVVELFQEIVALLGVRLFAGKADIGVDVTCVSGEFCVGVDLLFGTPAVAQDALRSFLIVPKVRLGDACFEGFQALAMLRGVKESSAPARYAA